MPTVFPFRHNWREPYEVELALSTNVIDSADGTEQRRQLRAIPRRREQFSITADGRRAGALDALLLTGQTEQWAVPFWPHGTALTAPAAPGSSVELECDTTDRDFVEGGLAVLWGDEFTTELVTLEAVSGSSVTAATLAGAWPAGTEILPARLGRWAGDFSLGRPGAELAEVPVAFLLEGLADPAVATPGSPPVFDVVPVNRQPAPTDALSRAIVRFDSPTGGFSDLATGARPRGARSFTLYLEGLDEVRAIEQWYYSLKGALTAFWLPTFQADLVPTGPIGAADTSITIEAMRYAERLLGIASRQHLALIPPVGSIVHRVVSDATDNEDGTETLELSAAAGVNLPFGALLSLLLLVRLAEDPFTISWQSTGVATATLRVVELPLEVAA